MGHGVVPDLRRAKRIFIAAHDFSRFAASYLENRLLTLELDCHMLDLQSRQGIFRRLSSLPPEDGLLIPITIPPYSNDTISVVRYCASIGMPIAALTDRPASPVVAHAQTTLLCHVELMGMTNSCTSMIGLVDTLAMLYTFTDAAQSRAEKSHRAALRQKFDNCFEQRNTSI